MNQDGPQSESLIGLIDRLVEPPPPDVVPMVPQTAGWLWLLALLSALLIWGLLRWRHRHRANAYRRAALARLSQATTAAELAEILRRAALAAFPRAEVASLTGDAWRDFLTRTGRRDFPAAAGTELNGAQWRDPAAPASPQLHAAARHWLKAHRAGSLAKGGA